MTPRKILVVSFQSVTPSGPMGMACFGLSIAERLRELGHDVLMVVSSVRGYAGRVNVVPVSRLSGLWVRILSLFVRWRLMTEYRKRYLEERLFDHFCRRLVDGRFDLVISTNSFAPDTLARAREREIPTVLIPGNPNDLLLSRMVTDLAGEHHIVHTDAYNYEPRNELFRRTIGAASHVFCYSRVIHRSFADLVPAGRLNLHSGLLKFKEMPPERRYPDTMVFGYLAYTVLLKGLDTLLAAWERVHPTTTARLLIGGAVDSSVWPLIRRYYDERERYRIDFVGDVSDIASFFQGCSVVVVPSYIDGQPAVAVEAMACARPVIVTSACGVADFVIEEQDGLTVPAKDAAALARAMMWFMEAPDRVTRCGGHARETYDGFRFKDYIGHLTDDILSVC